MHINSNSSPPFCQSSTKGLKTKQTDLKEILLPLKTKLIKKMFFLYSKQGINQGMLSPFLSKHKYDTN